MKNSIVNKLGLLLELSILCLLLNVNPNAGADSEQIPSVELALNAIREADAAGADVSGEIIRFNSAMDLLRQASASDFNSCSSYDSCVDEANMILTSITDDSMTLREQAWKKSYEKIVISEIIIVTGAFPSSLFVLYIYRHWKSSQQRRILNKDIAERK